jgi:hypothetical protein
MLACFLFYVTLELCFFYYIVYNKLDDMSMAFQRPCYIIFML